MFVTLRVRDLVLFVISILSIIGLLVYIPLADAEIPAHLGLSIKQDDSELSINDDKKLDLFDFSFMDLGTDSFTDSDPVIEEGNKEEIKEKDEIEYPTERGIYLVRKGMPKNTRHLKEGYWIGALPTVQNIEVMKNNGIKVILTVSNPGRSWTSVKRKIKELEIEHIFLPIGSRFPKNTSFYDTLLNYDPNEIFIHCDHGSDRSGTVIAYLLARRNHWPIQRALLAMVNPSKIDTEGLKKVLKQHGYEITEEDLFYTSIYSGASNGGFGGLKARDEDYRRLVSTMINSF